jgi:peptidylprolyl isomerase
MAIANGDMIKVHYTGTLDDGTVFDDSTKRGEPLEFTVGKGELIAGFDKAVVGMNQGDETTIRLEPADAYGEWTAEALHKVPRNMFPAEQTPVIDMTVALTMPNGRQVPAIIREVAEEEVTIDLNHPLAGQTLNFAISIVSC